MHSGRCLSRAGTASAQHCQHGYPPATPVQYHGAIINNNQRTALCTELCDTAATLGVLRSGERPGRGTAARRLPTCHGLAGSEALAPGWGPQPWAEPCAARGWRQAHANTAKVSFLLLLRQAGLWRRTARHKVRGGGVPQAAPSLPCPLQAKRPPPPAQPSLAPRSPSPARQPSRPTALASPHKTLPHAHRPRQVQDRAGHGRPAPALRHLLPTGARAEPADRGRPSPPRGAERPARRATPRPRGTPSPAQRRGAASRGEAVPAAAGAGAPAPRAPPRLCGAPTSASAVTGKGRGHVTHTHTHPPRGHLPARAAGRAGAAVGGAGVPQPAAGGPPAPGALPCPPCAGKPGRHPAGPPGSVPPPPPGLVRGDLSAAAVPSGPRSPVPLRHPLRREGEAPSPPLASGRAVRLLPSRLWLIHSPAHLKRTFR